MCGINIYMYTDWEANVKNTRKPHIIVELHMIEKKTTEEQIKQTKNESV